jgi:hypothetical protein
LTDRDLEYIASKIADMLSVQPRWMKLKQAAAYSSIGEKELIRLAKEKQITGGQDKTLKTKQWVFDRQSIDEYRSNQFINQDHNQFAIEMMNRIDV